MRPRWGSAIVLPNNNGATRRVLPKDTEEEEMVLSTKRIVSVLAVAAVMAAMVLASRRGVSDAGC